MEKRGTGIFRCTALMVCAVLVLSTAGCGYGTASGGKILETAAARPQSADIRIIGDNSKTDRMRQVKRDLPGVSSRTVTSGDALKDEEDMDKEEGKWPVKDVTSGDAALELRMPLYTNEAAPGEWSAVKAEYTAEDIAGNDTNKISLSPGSSMGRILGVMKSGEFKIEYETYNSGAAHAFLLLDNNENAIINIGGASSGNMNIMPDQKTSGKVSQWVALLKDTWVKVIITVDLDKSNADGVLDFTCEVYRTGDYDSGNTQWTLVGSFDENAYITPGGGSNGANKAGAHENGAATDGLDSFNIAAVKMVNDKGKTLYYDNIYVEAEGMQAVRSLESTEMTGKPVRTEYPVGAGVDLSGITIKGVFRYDYPDGSTEYLETEITDYAVLYDFSRPGSDIPVTIRVADGESVFEHIFYVAVYGMIQSPYLLLQYTDEEELDGIKLSDSRNAAVHSGTIDALDVSNLSNKIQISKGTATINFGEVVADGTVYFETEFLTQATSGASLFFRLVNSENLPLVDIGQYGSSNLNLYLDRKTSGDTSGQFKNLPVRKWAKAAVAIDLDASKEQRHLVFTAVVWTTDNREKGCWTEFARFDESLYLNSTAASSTTGAASTVLTMFDVAGIEFCNAGSEENYYDNVFFEGVGAGTQKVLEKLEIAAYPEKMEYMAGDSFDNRGLVLMGEYTYTHTDGTLETVEREVNAYQVDFENITPSEQAPVTITAEGKSVQFYVKVKANMALAGIAEAIVSHVNNGLVTMGGDGTVCLNKRNIKLPPCIGGNDLSYSTESEGAVVKNNILTVTPRTDGKSAVKLEVTLHTRNSDSEEVALSTEILFLVEQASSQEPPSGTLVSAEDFKAAVRTLIDNGVISGQDRLSTAGNVLDNFDRPIKTEEFVSMLVHAFDVDTTFTDTVINRSDIDYNAWYAEDIIAAFQLSAEPRASREGGTEYGVGDDLTEDDAEYILGRMKALHQTDKGGVAFERGLPAQTDSGEWLVDVKEPMSYLPAFPGAEGYAKFITGGRGGKVIHVTNLNSGGEGSLLAALDNNGNRSEPRIIVFDVGGTIDWTKDTSIGNYKMLEFENVTIAGQTAPGSGITLINGNFYFAHSSNMIIRFINFRHGQDTLKDDSCYIENSNNIMIDHCSFSYGSDESMSSRYNSNLTIQWSLIADGVRTHSMGGLQEWNSESILHSLLANQNDRNPKAKGIMDFVNNVLYNWGADGYVAGGNSGGACWGNLIGNYFIAGLDTKSPYTPICRSNGKYMMYCAGNLVDSNKNGRLDGVNTGIDMIRNDGGNYPERFTFEDLPLVLLMNRMNMSEQDGIDSADETYHKVMTYAGASLYGNMDGTTSLSHNEVDEQIISGVVNQTGKILLHNGESRNEKGKKFDDKYFENYPSLDCNNSDSPFYASRLDTDRDGMPDIWETAKGLDPKNPEDRNSIAPSGYTYIEEYLNELAAPAFPGDNQEEPDRVLSYDKERTYRLEMDYGEDKVSYNLYQTENNLMVPLAPVLEYLGFRVTQADGSAVISQYPWPVDNPINLDTLEGLHTVTPGADKFTFSYWTGFNDAAQVYNGVIYIPVSMVPLALGGVYEQEITDPVENLAVITVHDAEVYKNWHDGSSIRNIRKISAPSMDFAVTEGGLRLMFDKEASVAGPDKLITIWGKDGKRYYAAIGSAGIWGSHKVFTLKWQNFISEAGEHFEWGKEAVYNLSVEAGAVTDYYDSSLITPAVESAIYVSADCVADISVPEFQAPADELNSAAVFRKTYNNNGGSDNSSGSDNNSGSERGVFKVSDAVKLLYEQLPSINVNQTNYDMIDGRQASRAGLQTVVNRADALKASDYTQESYDALIGVLAAARDILSRNDAGTEEIDSARENLLNAINSLVKAGGNKPVGADKTMLEELVRRAEALEPGDYTQESYAVLERELENARRILAMDDQGQEEVDASVMAVEQAIAALVRKADTDKDPGDDEKPSEDGNQPDHSDDGSEEEEGGGTNDGSGEDGSPGISGHVPEDDSSGQDTTGLSENPESPATADSSGSILPWAAALFISLLAGGAAILRFGRKNDRNDVRN